MSTENSREVADVLIAMLNRAVSGEPVDPFGILDENVDYVRHGIEGSAAHLTKHDQAAIFSVA